MGDQKQLCAPCPACAAKDKTIDLLRAMLTLAEHKLDEANKNLEKHHEHREAF